MTTGKSKSKRTRRAERDVVTLSVCAEVFFADHGRTEWPTVRVAARQLGWTMARVVRAVDADPTGKLSLSSYFAKDSPSIGGHLVERHDAFTVTQHAVVMRHAFYLLAGYRARVRGTPAACPFDPESGRAGSWSDGHDLATADMRSSRRG